MPLSAHCNNFTGNAIAANQLFVPDCPGLGIVETPSTIDGVCILFHGESITLPVVPLAPDVVDAMWITDLLADNWAVIYPSRPEDSYPGIPFTGLINDLGSATSNNGAQYNTTQGLWADHIFNYCNRIFPGKKIMVCGVSAGGFTAMWLAKNYLSKIIGGVAHVPATIWSNVNVPTFTMPGNTTGLDLPTTALNNCTAPMMVSYGTSDTVVGYDLAGTGGTPVSNTDSIITNAVNAGRPITRNAVAEGHVITPTDVTTFMSYIEATIDPLR